MVWNDMEWYAQYKMKWNCQVSENLKFNWEKLLFFYIEDSHRYLWKSKLQKYELQYLTRQ